MKSQNKTIFRVIKTDNPFVQIDKYCLNDTKLSWKAKGLLCYMLSMPDNWKFYETELVRHADDGQSALRSALRELQEVGYIVKRVIRDEKGRIVEHETLVFERPHPDYENPHLDNPQSGKPHTTNNNMTNNNITNKDITDKENKTSNKFDAHSFSFFNIVKENGCVENFEDESEAVHQFIQEYRIRLDKDHPPVRDSQMNNILISFQEFYDVVATYRDLDDVMQEYFLRDDIDTDYNLNHFASWVGGLANKVNQAH